jgi:transcriptional regulator with XRE-family HTH domain
MNIGPVIRKLREAQGETLEELAFAIGTDGGNLSRIERGKQQPALNALIPIAAALHTTPAELIAAACDQAWLAEQPDTEIKLLLRNYRALSSENQQLAHEFVRLLSRLQNEKG